MISSLTLFNFRNHVASRIDTANAQFVVITGPNGSGKTSILEAISMFASGATLRGDAAGDILRTGAIEFFVNATLSDNTEISMSYAMGDAHRRGKIDADTAPLSDFSRVIRPVWITPAEDRLFVDDTRARRGFFDRLISAFDSAHAGRTARLSKLLSERAFALKSAADNLWLNTLDTQIAAISVAIAAARLQYIQNINRFLDGYTARAIGVIENSLCPGVSAVLTESEYLKYLRENRTMSGDKMTIDGAHKTDFSMFNHSQSRDVATTSTGQQKSALLALIVAHTKLLNSLCTANSVVLIDEAAAHLDRTAQQKLFDELSRLNSQIWLTGITTGEFADIPNAVYIACDNGNIK